MIKVTRDLLAITSGHCSFHCWHAIKQLELQRPENIHIKIIQREQQTIKDMIMNVPHNKNEMCLKRRTSMFLLVGYHPRSAKIF